MQKVRAKIHLKSIKDNALAFKNLTKTKLCAVIKAEAYGHGSVEIANALSGIADCFAVSLIDEAIAVRSAVCGKDVLVLTPPLSKQEAYLGVVNGFILTVGSLRTAKLIADVCKEFKLRARVHLKVNTGMNRYGMLAPALGKTCKFLRAQAFVNVQGVYSHLYDANEETARLQRSRFLACKRVCDRYFENLTAHLSATYGTLLGEDFAFDMVRVGIGLYGYLPSGLQGKEKTVANGLKLKKGMTVYGTIVQTRIYSGGGIAYGKPQKTAREISLIRVGYADGFARTRKNGTCGFENNANNLCMDACIRVGRLKQGQEIPLMIDADETAKAMDTISYEVLCNATKRAVRVFDEY